MPTKRNYNIISTQFVCLFSCETLLYEFLKSIRHEPTALDMPLLTNILVQHANSPNELIQFTAIDWIREFVQLSGANMLEHASGIFTAILPCLAYEGEPRKSKKLTILWCFCSFLLICLYRFDRNKRIYCFFVCILKLEIKSCAQSVNKNMLELVSSEQDKAKVLKNLNLESVLKVLRQYLDLAHSSVETKVAALNWIHHLFTQMQNEVYAEHFGHLFTMLDNYSLTSYLILDVSVCNESISGFIENFVG